jgi:VWFA-related protein
MRIQRRATTEIWSSPKFSRAIFTPPFMDGGKTRTAYTLTRLFSRTGSLPLRHLILVAIRVSPVLLVSLACRAQESPSAPLQAPLQTKTELVRVDVSVLNKSGNFIGGLAQKDFRILEGGLVQPIVYFSPVDAPAQVLVLVETSPAVYLIQNEHLIAAFALLDGLAAEDQVALVTYDEAPHAILPFTPDKFALTAALGQIQYTLGTAQLNFFESISAVVDWISPIHGKKAIVILSTGLDSSPPARFDALAQKLRAQDAVIFPVALGGSLRQASGQKKKGQKNTRNPDAQPKESPEESWNPLSFAKADAGLLSLAKITGGRAYFPASAKEFSPIYREIARVLRHQYVLGIVPAQDGKFHSLTIEVVDASGQPVAPSAKSAEFRVFAREGYLAPGP